MATYDILQQCNKDNPYFYIEAVFGDDIEYKELGILNVLSQQDIDNVSQIMETEVGCGTYDKYDIERDLLYAGGYMLVARLHNWLNGHKPGEVVGAAIVYNDRTNIAQERNYFIDKDLNEAYIAMIGVRKDVRDRNDPNCIRGIGSAMLHCVHKIAEREGCKYVTLSSIDDPNTLKFYNGKGMLKSCGQFMHFTKVISPHAETVARVVYDIMEYMKSHRIRRYKQFVARYKCTYGNEINALVGNHASKDEQLVAKMMLDNSASSVQHATIFNAKRLLSEMYSASLFRPDFNEYLEYMYINTMDKDGYYNKTRPTRDTNTYLKKLGRTSVIQQMSEKQQQKMMYIFNTVGLMQADKLTQIK